MQTLRIISDISNTSVRACAKFRQQLKERKMQIHYKNVPHLHEEVELPAFKSKGKIAGYAGIFSPYNTKTLSDELVLVRLIPGKYLQGGDIFIDVIPFVKGHIKILNCTCNCSKQGYRE